MALAPTFNEKYQKKLESLLYTNSSYTGKFIGSQPMQIIKSNITRLMDNNITFSPKIDGTRYLMLLNNEGIAFVGRDNQWYTIPPERAKESLAKQTEQINKQKKKEKKEIKKKIKEYYNNQIKNLTLYKNNKLTDEHLKAIYDRAMNYKEEETEKKICKCRNQKTRERKG